MSKAVAIDPSVNRIGYCIINNIYHDDELGWNAEEAQWTWGSWKIRSGSLTFKLKEISDNFDRDIGGLNPKEDHLVVEWPQYFDQQRGQAAAVEGYTTNLAAINAYLFGYYRLPWRQFHPIFPSKWKGNLNKDVTRMRFFREIGVNKHYRIDHDTVDATMMLLWWCKHRGITNKIINYAVEMER